MTWQIADSISSKFMCAWYTNIIFRSTSSISCHSRQKLRSKIDRKWIFLAYNFCFERTSVLYFDWNVSNWQCMVSNGRFVLVNNRSSSSSSSSIVMEMCLDFFTESVNRSESVCVCLLELYCSMSYAALFVIRVSVRSVKILLGEECKTNEKIATTTRF